MENRKRKLEAEEKDFGKRVRNSDCGGISHSDRVRSEKSVFKDRSVSCNM